MRQKIDFTQKQKEAERDYVRNKNVVIGRLSKRKSRVTGQVRMSITLIRKLKLHAYEEGQTMSNSLDKIVGQFFKKK